MVFSAAGIARGAYAARLVTAKTVVMTTAVAAALAGEPAVLAPPPPAVALPTHDFVRSGAAIVERRYRANGRVRLLLFWAGRDNVGAARLRAETTADGSSLALLAGSDPERAPNRLNQWIYLREERARDDARVFALRSITDAESAPDPTDAVLDGPQFGASCAAMTPAAVRSASTTVTASNGLTYAMFGRVLDQVAMVTTWIPRRSARPSGSEIGFLSALEELMVDLSLPSSPAGRRRPVRLYVYNGVPYDLALIRHERRDHVVLDGHTYDSLQQADFTVRNRSTRNVSRFSVTWDVPGQACDVILPVQITYQPNWWLKIELRLDDRADLPDDPAAEPATLTRIRHLCARATE